MRRRPLFREKIAGPMAMSFGRFGQRVAIHIRRQAVGYLALAVALGGSAYAGRAGSNKVGATDLRPVVERLGEQVIVPPGESRRAEVSCKRRERALAPLAIGGAVQGDGALTFDALGIIVQNGKAKRAFVAGFNSSSTQQVLEPRILCLRP
jgi:hypothetical protein